MHKVVGRFEFVSKIVSRIKQSFTLFHIFYDRELAQGLKRVAWVYGMLFAAFGFFLILMRLFLPVLLEGFSPRISRELALEILRGNAAADGGLLGADFALVGFHMYLGPKGPEVVGQQPRKTGELGLVASLTFISFVLSIFSVFVSMSYLDEYTTRGSFVWPFFFMFCGIAGILYLLHLSAALVAEQRRQSD